MQDTLRFSFVVSILFRTKFNHTGYLRSIVLTVVIYLVYYVKNMTHTNISINSVILADTNIMASICSFIKR